MTEKKKRSGPRRGQRRSNIIQIAEVQKLRRKDNFEHGELEEFFARRDAYIAGYAGKSSGGISDFLQLSPMPLCRRWTLEEPE